VAKVNPSPSTKPKVNFSFEFYDLSGRYCISEWSKEQVKKSLERLKDINTKSFDQLQRERKTYHFGEVDWSKTIEKKMASPILGFMNGRPSTLRSLTLIASSLVSTVHIMPVRSTWYGSTLTMLFDQLH
jgi:hypothetical protein